MNHTDVTSHSLPTCANDVTSHWWHHSYITEPNADQLMEFCHHQDLMTQNKRPVNSSHNRRETTNGWIFAENWLWSTSSQKCCRHHDGDSGHRVIGYHTVSLYRNRRAQRFILMNAVLNIIISRLTATPRSAHQRHHHGILLGTRSCYTNMSTIDTTPIYIH